MRASFAISSFHSKRPEGEGKKSKFEIFKINSIFLFKQCHQPSYIEIPAWLTCQVSPGLGHPRIKQCPPLPRWLPSYNHNERLHLYPLVTVIKHLYLAEVQLDLRVERSPLSGAPKEELLLSTQLRISPHFSPVCLHIEEK